MQKKDQTFSKLCEFKALVEKDSRKQVKALRSDNGGEYISNEFKDFYSKEGIRRELIAPHNPQQNGVTERNNKTIVGATRAMLHDQGLPMHLWVEAYNTVVYLQNCCPLRVLGMNTPEEAFNGKKTDVSHFKIFGSYVYVHVTKNARKKSEPIVEVGIFVGYTETPHNYRVYLPNSKMIVMQRDIKFDEGKAMQLSLERELDLHTEEELLVPKDESQDVGQPHEEAHGVEEATHVEPSIRNGRKGKLLIIVLYVDDLILNGDEQLIHSCKEDLAKEFEMKDMGLLHYFLGLEIWQRDGELFVSQGKYAREILGKFHMEGCKPMDTPLPGNWRKEDATSREVVDATIYR
jgi:hypothetical protein